MRQYRLDRRVALVLVLGVLATVGCSGESGAERTCTVVPNTTTALTERISLAQCGDGSVCIGACGGTQDSNNPDNSTNNSNNPVDSNNRTIVNPTPTPDRLVGR